MSGRVLFSMAPNLALERACATPRQHVFGLTTPVEAAHVALEMEIFD
jgi:hypothetical protein